MMRKRHFDIASTTTSAKIPHPDPNDRTYFPTHDDLRNHIYREKQALQHSKYDQKNLRQKVQNWKKTHRDANFFFCPCCIYSDCNSTAAEGKKEGEVHAEISALECCFPDTIVYLCDFHHEQAWERWVKDGKHGLTSEEADQLLAELRACAWAPPGKRAKILGSAMKNWFGTSNIQKCGKITHVSSSGYQQHGFPGTYMMCI